MRRRDCVGNLDTPSACAQRHRQMTIKCAYSNVELRCSVLRANYTRVSSELVMSLIDITQRMSLIVLPFWMRVWMKQLRMWLRKRRLLMRKM